ncbi:MAG TPA: restriction endonuclease subunit S [Nitrososphaeraceae archaeon]|nr:restriction endonuclease subunit S [Nitrososphaeraceae archaeon]
MKSQIESNMLLPEAWEFKKISDLCYVVRGGSPRPKGDPRYFDGPIPWIKISDATENDGKFIVSTREGLKKEGVPKSRFLKSGTLVLTNSATICLPKILQIDGCIHDGFLAFLSLNSNVDKFFLYYYFLWQRENISRNIARGLAQKNLNTTLVKDLVLPLPPLNIQLKIVQKLDHILGKFDEIKFSLRSIQHRQLGNLTFIRNRLFVQVVSDIFGKYNDARKYKISEFVSGPKTRNPRANPDVKFLYVELGSIDNENKTIASFQTLEGKNAPSRARNIIKKDNVIYATTRPYYRNVSMVPAYLDNQMCSTGFCVMEVNDRAKLLPTYLYYFLQSDQANEQILRSMRGGNYPAVSSRDIIDIFIPILPSNIQESIVNRLNIIHGKAGKMRSKISEIDIVRKKISLQYALLYSSVLQKAFSGKLIN